MLTDYFIIAISFASLPLERVGTQARVALTIMFPNTEFRIIIEFKFASELFFTYVVN